MTISDKIATEYNEQSLNKGHQSSLTFEETKSPQQAGTAKILNKDEPTIVPTPISPFVTNVPIIFINSSGDEVAAAIIVAPTTSFCKCISVKSC